VATSYEWHPEALPEDAMRTPKTVRLKAPYCSRDDGWDHKLTIKSTTAWTPRAHISPKYSQQQNSHDKSQKTKNHGKEEVVDPPLIELFPHFANKRVHANTWLNHEQDPEDEAAKLSHNIDPSSRKEFFRDSFGKGHPDELCSHATWSHSRAGGKFKPLQLKIRGEAAKDDLARARAEELENYKQTLLHKYEWERQSKWKGKYLHFFVILHNIVIVSAPLHGPHLSPVFLLNYCFSHFAQRHYCPNYYREFHNTATVITSVTYILIYNTIVPSILRSYACRYYTYLN